MFFRQVFMKQNKYSGSEDGPIGYKYILFTSVRLGVLEKSRGQTFRQESKLNKNLCCRVAQAWAWKMRNVYDKTLGKKVYFCI